MDFINQQSHITHHGLNTTLYYYYFHYKVNFVSFSKDFLFLF